jgi:hypothetical protein
MTSCDSKTLEVACSAFITLILITSCYVCFRIGFCALEADHYRMKARRNILLIGLPLLAFGGATALAYWEPTRIQSGASPYEWAAFYSYLTALLVVSLCTFFDLTATLKTAWLTFFSNALLFGIVGWIIEYFVYFNGNDWEKEEGRGILVGCIFLAAIAGLVTTCAWPLRKFLGFRTTNVQAIAK